MHRFIRAALLAICLLAATAPLAFAGPSRMSYQGVLTDNLGNLVPDGNYSLTFTIYDAAVAGTAYWSENHAAVPVVKGGFSVVLGSVAQIDVPFYSSLPFYLGVQVGADPELTPRIELVGSPSAMSLGMVGDTGTPAGEGNWLPSASGYGAGGGFLHLYNLAPFGIANLEPDFSGEGFWIFISGYSGSYINWDGDTGTSEGSFTVGGTWPTYISPGLAGNDAVQTPADAISSGEVLDEPGIAQGHSNGTINIPDAGMVDLVTVSITTPAAGYIVVEADAQHGIDGDGTNPNYAALQIDETAGGVTDAAHYFNSGFNPTANVFTWTPVSVRRVYQKVAGTYTFRLEGDANNPAGQLNYLWNPTITATFYPTAYGTVTTAASGPELARFSEVTRTVSGPNGPGGAPSEGALVDLRELELRVRREETRLAESRLQLHRAQMKQQQETSARAAAARRGGAPIGATTAPAPKEER